MNCPICDRPMQENPEAANSYFCAACKQVVDGPDVDALIATALVGDSTVVVGRAYLADLKRQLEQAQASCAAEEETAFAYEQTRTPPNPVQARLIQERDEARAACTAMRDDMEHVHAGMDCACNREDPGDVCSYCELSAVLTKPSPGQPLLDCMAKLEDSNRRLVEACEKMIEWDDAEKAAKPFVDDNGAAFYHRMELCGQAFDMARAALAAAMEAKPSPGQPLFDRLAALSSEKDRRIYYQDIAYTVCNWLDNALSQKTICGTIETPAIGVQDGLRAVGDLVIGLRDKLDARAKEIVHVQRVADDAMQEANSLRRYSERQESRLAAQAKEIEDLKAAIEEMARGELEVSMYDGPQDWLWRRIVRGLGGTRHFGFPTAADAALAGVKAMKKGKQ